MFISIPQEARWYVRPHTKATSTFSRLQNIIMQPMHIKTPLLESHPLSKIVGCPVYLKLDNVQPVSSFKLRGLGNLCQKVSIYFDIYNLPFFSIYKIELFIIFFHDCKCKYQ